MTLHNLRFQGTVSVEEMKEITGLPDALFAFDKLEFYGQVNPMKKGVYTVRCVVRNSLGMKSVKHIQVLVD